MVHIHKITVGLYSEIKCSQFEILGSKYMTFNDAGIQKKVNNTKLKQGKTIHFFGYETGVLQIKLKLLCFSVAKFCTLTLT